MIGSKSAPYIGSGAKLYEKFLALLMAVALCVGLTPAVAFADPADESITVALTVVDSDGTAAVNAAYEMPAGSTVKDLLDKSGVVYADGGYGYADFLNKSTADLGGGNWAYWASFFDGVADFSGTTALASVLKPNGHYQFVYGDGSGFAYSEEIPQLVPAAINNPWPVYGEDEPGDPAAVNPYDAEKASELMNNLAARFSKGGADGELFNNTAYAAFALNTLGKGASIDSESVLSGLAALETADGFSLSAGAMAKYIMMLENAGVDCAAVEVNGVEKNLYEEMGALVAADESVYSQVFILAAYGYCASDGYVDEATAVASSIVSSQSTAGLWGYVGWEDVQTTAQTVLALIPYADVPGVQHAIDAAVEAMLGSQQPDGGFAYMPGEGAVSDLDTTATVVSALAALNYDPNAGELVTENGSTPVGYLVARADSDLCGYEEADLYDETMTAATVLMALAANNGGAGCNVYVVKDVASGAPQPENPAGPSGQQGNTLAQSGDDAGFYVGVAGVLALGAICTLVAARRKMGFAQDARDTVLK